MSEQKFTVPVEVIDLPSKGLIYPVENPLSSGKIDMKYMTAREEDILTNINLLRQGIAIEKMLISLIKSPINHDDLIPYKEEELKAIGNYTLRVIWL